MIRGVLVQLLQGRELSAPQAEEVFEALFEGTLDDAQIASLLSLMQTRGVAVEELIGAARAMRRHATAVPVAGIDGVIIDTCGTGGAPKTFNISTVAALVTAAGAPGRVRVAKHGNRSRTGRGSAEILAELGVNVDASPSVQARCLAEAGVCFCFAVHHHPATRHAGAVRKSLGFPTIFNLLGPLTNPAGAARQLIGVYDKVLVEPMARALAGLGAERAMVVHGRDGMDEISTTAPTDIATVDGGEVTLSVLDTESLGVARSVHENLRAETMDEAVRIVRGILTGGRGPCRDITVVNSGAALMVAGAAGTVQEGMALAEKAIDSGDAMRVLEKLVEVSKG